ncbi:MAG: serine/threonine protein kinase [Deltaproteobacteria bacterium]|nr:serine/threonine protein kinase [Deltaproteobacteria bacterium]
MESDREHGTEARPGSEEAGGDVELRPGTAPVAERGRERDCFSQTGLPRRFGRYQLLKLLARGGMGQVFLAATTGVEGAERPVILKVIRREHARDPNFLARFLDEARVQAQLQHPGVAQVLEAAIHEPTGDPFVVIEHVEGRSLGNVRRRIAEVGLRLRWEDAVALGMLVSEGLAHIHERTDASGKPLRIVHRDLSPHNVMIGYTGEVKIIDFGTARGQNRRCHTVAGVVFAKPGYVAPEVANGDSGDFRVDLYAAGVMLWELCAGRRFLQGDAQEHTSRVAAGTLPMPPIAAAVGAPEELDRVIARMTAHERDDRFTTTNQAAVDLAKLLRHAAPLPTGERSVRARVAQLMYGLYPTQPSRARREFGKLVAEARSREPEEWVSPLEEREPSADPGLLAGTRYRILQQIGRGASSIVFEAEHVELGRRVALKVLDPERTHSREFSVRFRREARALSRLQHPNLVRVYDFGQAADGRMYSAMEFVPGETLRAHVDRGETFGHEKVMRIGLQAARALFVAHRAGIVHRDIKPENIILTPQGEVKVLDFGIAKTANEVGASILGEAEPESHPLGALTLFGTPEYMAPEQATGGKFDGRADLYALGCVLYELLTGRLPFNEDSDSLLLDAKLKGNPTSVRAVAGPRAVPRSVERVVMRLLARHPSRRFAGAAELLTAIAEVLDEPTRMQNRRRAVGASVLAAAMGFGVVFVAGQLRPHLARLPEYVPWLKQREAVVAPDPATLAEPDEGAPGARPPAAPKPAAATLADGSP